MVVLGKQCSPSCRDSLHLSNYTEVTPMLCLLIWCTVKVYCRVFVFKIIDYSANKVVMVNSRKCATEIVYFRSNP